ncbi:hypothetical protein ACWDBD_17305 [Streptomyces sp. NPDC001118]
MPGRRWEPTKEGANDLSRWLSKGATVYTINRMATHLCAGPARTYTAHTFDRRSWITGELMTGHLSASGLLGQSGTVYEHPPAGIPELGSFGGQSAIDQRKPAEPATAGSRR